MKEDQGSTQDMQGSLSTKHNTQEFGVLGDNILLEPHSGVGGFGSAQNCVLEKDGGSGDYLVSVSVQTVHTNCILVRMNNHSTVALD